MINANSLRFVSWNVNGLQQCTQNGFQKFFRKIDADFFSVQITKMQEKDKKFSFNGYYEFWNDSQDNKNSGTLIYTKHKPVNVTYGLPDGSYRKEGTLITLEYIDFYLINCFVPKAYIDQLDERLEYLERIKAYYQDLLGTKPVIVNGDMDIVPTIKDTHEKNLNIRKPGFTPEERDKFGELLDLGLVDSFRYLNPFTEKYSKWSFRDNQFRDSKGHRTDLVLVQESFASKIQKAEILTHIKGSTHAPIMMDVFYPFGMLY